MKLLLCLLMTLVTTALPGQYVYYSSTKNKKEYGVLTATRTPVRGNQIRIRMSTWATSSLIRWVVGIGPRIDVPICGGTGNLLVVPAVWEGSTTWNVLHIDIPNNPWLLGQVFQVQWTGWTPWGCFTSNAVEVTIL